MGELIVVAFRDQFRAAEVLNELRRRDWGWGSDLDDAVAVALDENGKARVQLNLDLSLSETASWIGLWSSLLRVALFVPISVTMATGELPASAVANNHGSPALWGIPDSAWWTKDLRLSENFLRDIGALVKAETSAIFMLLQTKQVSAALQHIHNYGGMIIHTRLSPEQVQKMTAVLAVA